MLSVKTAYISTQFTINYYTYFWYVKKQIYAMHVQEGFDQLTLETWHMNKCSYIIDKYEQTRQC